MTSKLEPLWYWRHKTPADNQWHPLLRPALPATNVSSTLERLDLEAAAIDAAPFMAAAGSAAYLRQLPSLGVTAPASPFKNLPTLRMVARSANVSFLAVLGAQAAGVEYRDYIPRWAHTRERNRDEGEARDHVRAGMIGGGVVLLIRNVFRIGPLVTRRSLMDVIIGGAIADMLLREYYRAHSIG